MLSSFSYFTRKDLDVIARLHGLVKQKLVKAAFMEMLKRHTCSDVCAGIVYVFKPLSKERLGVRLRFRDEKHTAKEEAGRLLKKSLPVQPKDEGSNPDQDGSATTKRVGDDTKFFDPFVPVGEAKKLIIIKDWEETTSTERTKMVVCCSCSIREVAAETSWIKGEHVDFRLLKNDALPIHLHPTTYDLSVYSQAVLNYKGLEFTDRMGHVRLCVRCQKSLNSGNMPKFALCNWLYYGRELVPEPVKAAFEDSSLFEKMLVARGRSNSICCRFRGDYNDGPDAKSGRGEILERARKGIRGNVMVAPLSVVRLHKILPPAISFIRDTMCVVFVGDKAPSRSTISKFGPVLVRKSRVKMIIEFLLAYNPHYGTDERVVFSQHNLDNLFPDDQDSDIPSAVHIGHLSPNEALEVVESDYTPRNDDETLQSDGVDEILMENVGYTEGDDSSMAYQSMKMIALQRCLTGKPFVVSGSGGRMIPDFNNPSILTWLFPHLDPWGIGGFHHPGRSVKIGMEEQLCHLMKTDDPLFERDPEFAFVFFNVVRKYNVSRSLRFSVPRRIQSRIIKDILEIPPDVLSDLCSRFEKNHFYKPETESHRRALKTLKSINMMAQNVPGSDGYKVQLRNQIRAIIYALGTPCLFITLNPSDVDHPLVRVFAGEDIDPDDVLRGEDMDSWRRKLLAARNPAACARFFDFVVRTFVKVILKYGEEGTGLFGKCTGYYGTVEAQGKGTLHCHMLIWLQGHSSPQDMHESIVSSDVYSRKLFQWLDSIIMNEFPVVSAARSDEPDRFRRVRCRDLGEPHPGAVPSPSSSLAARDERQFWAEFNEYLIRILNEYYWHEHTPTCWKYLTRGQPKTDANCRLRMDGTLELETRYDPETLSIIKRRLHPRISSYNDVLAFVMRCNVNLQFVGSGDAAKAYIYYLTDYVTKPSLPLHVGLSALSYAIKKVSDNNVMPFAEWTPQDSSKAVTTVVNAMMGRQEISHQQVMSYLVGGGDHYTPFQFQILHRWKFLKYVSEYFERAEDESTIQGDSLTQYVSKEDDLVQLAIENGEISERNQVLDYCFRPDTQDYHNMSLYEFVSSRQKRRAGSKEDMTNARAVFSSSEHPQRYTHIMGTRTKRAIPILLGPAISNREKSAEAFEVWARDVLILFRPWRSPLELRGRLQTWTDAYRSYEGSFKPDEIRVIRNIQIMSECGDARDRVSGLRNRATFQAEIGDQNVECDAVEEEEDSGSNEAEDWKAQHGNDIFRTFSGVDSSVAHDVIESEPGFVKALRSTLGRDVANIVRECFPYSAEPSVQPRENEAVRRYAEDHWDSVIEHAGVMTLKRKRRVIEDDDQLPENPCPRQRIKRHQSPFAEVVTVQDRPFKEQDLVNGVIRDMGLEGNKEQLEAFKLVAAHVAGENPEQLLMYISGVGGTGKSHVIKSIVALFERLGRRRELFLGAPTGIAAVLIGGHTLHSLIMASGFSKSKNLAALVELWRRVRYLIIDEVSMLGARFLSFLSSRLSQAKGDDVVGSRRPFGGVNVIFVGDIGQLKPPKQYALYAYQLLKRPSAKEAKKQGIEAMNGVLIWQQVKTVVELKKNVRHSADPQYAAFLSRLRAGVCISGDRLQDDYGFLSPRLLCNLSESELWSFRDAPIIVGSKALRDILNVQLIAHHASRLGQKVNIYYSKDFVNRSPVPDNSREFMWSIPSSRNKDSLGRLPLFVGMKVMVTENLAFKSHIVNGTEGVVRSIYYEQDVDGKLYPTVVYIYVAGSGFDLPGLERDVVPIFPVRVQIERSDLHCIGIKGKAFTRLQLPLVPAYVYTDFKSQGRTLTKVIVDLVTARGQGPYVMLSRVTALSGLAILRWFPPSRIFSRLPEELRVELARLEKLHS